jgi:hypothetical protein
MMLRQAGLLVMINLGVLSDAPPVDLQPPIPERIHLRWAFQRDAGVPWHGNSLTLRQRPPHEPPQDDRAEHGQSIAASQDAPQHVGAHHEPSADRPLPRLLHPEPDDTDLRRGPRTIAQGRGAYTAVKTRRAVDLTVIDESPAARTERPVPQQSVGWVRRNKGIVFYARASG